VPKTFASAARAYRSRPPGRRNHHARVRTPLILTVATAALVAGALPASAADQTATFSLTAGGLLSSTLPTTSVALNNGLTGATSVSGPLGAVSVTDERGETSAWVATASSTTFTGPRGSVSTSVTYNAGTVTHANSTIDPSTDTVLPVTTTPVATVNVVAPSTVAGNNSASWTPTLTVGLPSSALVDNYSGIVTTSVA
jgi:hypothetical protein